MLKHNGASLSGAFMWLYIWAVMFKCLGKDLHEEVWIQDHIVCSGILLAMYIV